MAFVHGLTSALSIPKAWYTSSGKTGRVVVEYSEFYVYYYKDTNGVSQPTYHRSRKIKMLKNENVLRYALAEKEDGGLYLYEAVRYVR